MARSKSSASWLREHFSDPFVQKAQKEGYRSRAVYKLMELQKRDNFIKPGMTVIDLGAAPGGWSQLLVRWVGAAGHAIASDILEMEPIPGVTFIHGDFQEDAVVDEILKALPQQQADVLLSDMAPNMTGVASVDQSRSMYLAELTLDWTERALKPGGTLVTKAFEGAELAKFIQQLRKLFKTVAIRKPEASRQRSRELYLVAKGYGL